VRQKQRRFTAVTGKYHLLAAFFRGDPDHPTSGLFSIAGSQRLLRKVKTTLVLTSFVSRRRGSGNNAHGPSLIVFVRISSEKSGFSISLSFADENLHVVLLFKSIAVPVFRVRSFSAVIPIWRCLFS
jgi:hypothetical protein